MLIIIENGEASAATVSVLSRPAPGTEAVAATFELRPKADWQLEGLPPMEPVEISPAVPAVPAESEAAWVARMVALHVPADASHIVVLDVATLPPQPWAIDWAKKTISTDVAAAATAKLSAHKATIDAAFAAHIAKHLPLSQRTSINSFATTLSHKATTAAEWTAENQADIDKIHEIEAWECACIDRKKSALSDPNSLMPAFPPPPAFLAQWLEDYF